MNCWFCTTPLNLVQANEYQECHCSNLGCQEYNVLYKYFHTLDIVQFKTIINEKIYFINYWVTVKQMNVTKQLVSNNSINNSPLNDLFSYESVIHIPYESIVLTPNNVSVKLPLYLLFS